MSCPSALVILPAIERRSASPCRQAAFCVASGGKGLPPTVGGTSLTGVVETMIDACPSGGIEMGMRWLSVNAWKRDGVGRVLPT